MKILHISTSDTGGAASACIRLHEGLLEQGIDSHVLVLFKKKENVKNLKQYFEYQRPGIFGKFFNFSKIAYYPAINRFKLIGRKKGFEMFSSPYSMIDITKHPKYKEADIIHLHWTAHFLDYQSFFKNNTKPVVWVMHDLNAFTGGCHVSWDCNKFESNCSNCPQLKGTFNKNYSKRNLHIKLNTLKNKKNITIVSSSEWMSQAAGKSALFKNFQHEIIPIGINTNIFKPIDKSESRRKMNLPAAQKIILFIADKIDNYNKGFSLLQKALESIENKENILLCIAGSYKKKVIIPGIKIHELGYITAENKMAVLYSAADVTVVPSLSESFGQVTAESMACGTPAVAFAATGTLDIIDHNKNGWLAKPYYPEDLAAGILWILENSENDKGLSIDSRNKIVNYFSCEKITKRNIELYQKLFNFA